MLKSPFFQQHTSVNRSSLLQCLAIVLAGLAVPACQQAAEMEVESVDEQAAAVESDRAHDSVEMRDLGAEDDSDDAIDHNKHCLVPGPLTPYFNNEEALVFKSNPNPNLPYHDPSVCTTAPFTPTFSAGGRMTSVQYQSADAVVGNFAMEEVGYGTLCFKIQDPTFTPFGPPLLAYGKVTVSGISFTINGTCTVTNSATPVAGVSQMICGLPLVAPMPAGYVGGLLTTNSVLNLAGVQGISGGSILSLHLYKTPPAPVAPLLPIASNTARAMELDAQSLLPGATIW
jgi:hypothetical protein